MYPDRRTLVSFWGPIPPCNIGSFTLPLEDPMILRDTQFSTFSQTLIFGMLISTLTLCFFRSDTFRKLMVNVGKYVIHWLAGGFKHFFESSPPKLGKWSNLTRQHILQMGWFNHQLASLMWNTWDVNSWIECKYQTFTSLRCKKDALFLPWSWFSGKRVCLQYEFPFIFRGPIFHFCPWWWEEGVNPKGWLYN